HSNPTITAILTPSARSAPVTIPPADCLSPNEATMAETPPAHRLTAPPRAAESAPSTPATIPAMSVRAAVAINCQRSTVRIGLFRARKPAFTSARPLKAGESIFVSTAAGQCAAVQTTHHSAQFLEQLLQVVEPRKMQHDLSLSLASGADLHSRAEALRHFLLESREVAISAALAPRSRRSR